jgi:hypothetical protein
MSDVRMASIETSPRPLVASYAAPATPFDPAALRAGPSIPSCAQVASTKSGFDIL